MRSLLVLSGGHPYEAGPFDELLGALGHWDVTHLVHPEGGEVGHACANGLEELLTSRLAQCQPGGSGGVELCQIVGHRGSFGSWPLRKVRKAC